MNLFELLTDAVTACWPSRGDSNRSVIGQSPIEQSVSRFWRRAWIVLCAGFFLTVLTLPYLKHNLGLRRFRASFAELAHLPASVALHDLSAVGLLEGNGDHCDYFAGQFRETDLSKEEVRRHYATARVHRVDHKAYDSGFGEYVPVYVAFPDSKFDEIRHLVDAETRAAVHVKRSRKTLYLVYSFDGGYEAGFDLRCY